MIKSEKGMIEFRGTVDEITCDIACIITSLSDNFGKDKAKKIIEESTELGFMSKEELHRYEEAIKQFQRGVTSTFLKAMLDL